MKKNLLERKEWLRYFADETSGDINARDIVSDSYSAPQVTTMQIPAHIFACKVSEKTTKVFAIPYDRLTKALIKKGKNCLLFGQPCKREAELETKIRDLVVLGGF